MDEFWQEYGLHAQTKTRDTREYGYHYLSGIIRMDKTRTIAEISRTAGVPYQNMHHYISNSPWSGAKVIKDARTEIAWHPHFETGSMLLGDESADARSGDVLVGGGRQYNGRLGKVDLSQVGVFLSIIKDGKHNWIDGELYLPEKWFGDDHEAVRERTGIPKGGNSRQKSNYFGKCCNGPKRKGFPLRQSPAMGSMVAASSFVRKWIKPTSSSTQIFRPIPGSI